MDNRIEIGEVGTNAIANGKALAGYCCFVEARHWASKISEGVPHDVWYTERNGDTITLVVPKGTEGKRLPNSALGYFIIEWIPPEADFGCHEGVRVYG